MSDRVHSSFLRIFLEFGPLALFFFLNNQYDLIIASGVFALTTCMASILLYVVEKQLPFITIISAVFAILFGGATFVFENEVFIKFKPTLVNLIFSAILAFSIITKKYLLQKIFHTTFSMHIQGWKQLEQHWLIFFLIFACLNEIIWRNFTSDQWVFFKTWCVMPCTLLFTGFFILPIIKKYSIHPQDPSS